MQHTREGLHFAKSTGFDKTQEAGEAIGAECVCSGALDALLDKCFHGVNTSAINWFGSNGQNKVNRASAHTILQNISSLFSLTEQETRAHSH